MGLFSLLLKGMSEDSLRDKEEKMRRRVDDLEDNPKRQVKLDSRRLDVVNEISSRCSGKMPKSEHGWYLPEDDD